MKNRISKILFTVALFITSFIGFIDVNAFNTSLSPSKTTVNPGDTFTISIKLSSLTDNITSANYDVTYDSNLFTYVNCSEVNGLIVNEKSNPIKLGYASTSGIGNGVFATMTFKANTSITSDTTGEFKLSSVANSIADINENVLSSNDTGTSVKVHVVSTNNDLSDLKVNGTSIKDFSKDKTNYEITTDESSIKLEAITADSNSKVTGIGTKTLAYGENTFNIVVTSEKGTTKTYKVVVNRTDTRSDDATLKNISIDGVSFSFKSDKNTYNLTIDKESVNISAIKNNEKSTISGDVGTKKLAYGNNTLRITVTSEKGTKNTYTLNITRKDARSANNNLASLKLSEGTIDFKASTTVYDVTVNSNVTTITVSATLADSKASFVSGYGPRTINLVDGNNKLLIKVKNEKDEVKTYTININKDDGRETNADLEYLKVEEGTIEFDKDILEYKITVENDINNITLNTKAISSKAKVEITNPTLVVGENKVKILVTAENGATKEYVITVIKMEPNAILSDNNYLENILIEGYSLNFEKEILTYNLKINNEETLIINAYPSNENSSITILGNENLKNGSIISIRVISENGETREYKINIQTNKSTVNLFSNIPTNYLIVGLLVIILIILIIIIVIKKNKEKKDNNFSYNKSDNLNNINPIYTNNQVNTNDNNINNQVINNSETNNNITDNINNNNQNIPNNSVDNNQVNVDSNINNNTNNDISINNTNNNTNNTKPNNNASGLTKVCPSCGRRVPYEVGTCPYCLNDF